MGRTRGSKSKRDFLKERPGEATQSTVSLWHVNVPDAEMRLDQALEVLLARTLPPGEIITGQNLQGDQNGEDSAADGDAN